MKVRKMTQEEVQKMYPEAPGYSGEVGRFTSRAGAVYRAAIARALED